MMREGKVVKNIMALLDENPIALVAHQDSPAQSVRELRGRRIASTFPKAGTNLALNAILRHSGLEANKDVAIEYVGVDGLLPALRNRNVDAAIMPAVLLRCALSILGYKSGPDVPH